MNCTSLGPHTRGDAARGQHRTGGKAKKREGAHLCERRQVGRSPSWRVVHPSSLFTVDEQPQAYATMTLNLEPWVNSLVEHSSPAKRRRARQHVSRLPSAFVSLAVRGCYAVPVPRRTAVRQSADGCSQCLAKTLPGEHDTLAKAWDLAREREVEARRAEQIAHALGDELDRSSPQLDAAAQEAARNELEQSKMSGSGPSERVKEAESSRTALGASSYQRTPRPARPFQPFELMRAIEKGDMMAIMTYVLILSVHRDMLPAAASCERARTRTSAC